LPRVSARRKKKQREQRGRQRLLATASAIFALLAVVASAAAIFGFWQKEEVEKQTRLAFDAEQIATQQLEEAARSDRLVAQEDLENGKYAEALAYLARTSPHRRG
jgi:uncharacterized protein HemX